MDAPAIRYMARDRYIGNASRSDLVIWLIGSTATTPIVEEDQRMYAALKGNFLPSSSPRLKEILKPRR